MQRRIVALLVAVVSVSATDIPQVTAETGAVVPHEQLSAVLWMQRAPEYRANALQTWRAAAAALTYAAGAGTAAVEQETMAPTRLASLPTAVILDLDETVLDNSVYQARLIQAGERFDAVSWNTWVTGATAAAVPGALEFVRAARLAGHRVLYVTNRDCLNVPSGSKDHCPQLTATMRNLAALGFPDAMNADNYFLQGSRPEWQSSAKTLRRAWIAERYRIVMSIGDDLGDLVDGQTFAARRDELSTRFGLRWFVLPNPMYGSWERGYPSLEQKYVGLLVTPAALELPDTRRWDAGQPRDRLRVATWNIEYLIIPATHLALREGCQQEGDRIAGAERALPCAVAARPPRSEADFAALRKYAAKLDADVIALQEVDGPEAAALVLPGYDYCFTSRAHVQKNGFAIRRGLPYQCEPEYLPLSLDDEVRRGVVVTLFPGTRNEMRLMAVHLKSGCPAGPLTQRNRWCPTLARQVAPLEDWIDNEARAGRRFAVLGDFNRRLSLEKPPARDAAGRTVAIWPEIDDRDPPAADLVDITAGRKFIACNKRDGFTEYVDTMLVGRDLARSIDRRRFVRVAFDDEDVGVRQLSDHCPVGTELRLH
ncbi:MAG TPA: HAD family acid phosphatase [Steroidobacteraceae bacterium]|nr:HAD family acid phosphatase [Steroidobacteraceae bacterium]HRX88856.1 HAD family acid phosphatase [Steroidobacteraceae bacterium]